MKDFNIKANKIKGLIRHWRAKGINPGDTMKLMLLYLGVDRYLDPKTMIYPRKVFNQIRKENGYRSIPAMLEVLRQSGSFHLIYSRKADDIVAIVSPALKWKLEIEGDLCLWPDDKPITAKEKRVSDRDSSTVADGDSQYLNTTSEDVKQTSSKRIINTAEAKEEEINQINQLNGHLEVPLPNLNKLLFYDEPLKKAEDAVESYFEFLSYEPERTKELMGGFLKLLLHECHNDKNLAWDVWGAYIDDRLIPVLSRRKGIEHWKEKQIDGWLKSLHQPRLIRYKVSEALRNYQYRQANTL